MSKTISLKALEVFEELSRAGSMQTAARNLGLSAPAASQQLKNLETALGQTLIDHDRRPLTLSRGGQAYLVHVRAALTHLRQGAAELSLIDLQSVQSLKISIIDDFDSDVTPRLTAALASVLSPAQLSLMTAPSHRILQALTERQSDLGVAARPPSPDTILSEEPVLRDPFVLAVPRGHLPGPPDSLDALIRLPFLRYEASQLMARQIAAQLSRLRLEPQGRMELDSNQAIFGLIASGAGWAITTPLGYLRARQFHEAVDLHPLPFAGFSRTVSLFHRADWMPRIASGIADSLRGILRAQVVEPILATTPWLDGSLAILPD